MCLNNFRHDLSTALMDQMFKGFYNLCAKAHDIEVHLNKKRKPMKESIKVENIMTIIDHPKYKPPSPLEQIFKEI